MWLNNSIQYMTSWYVQTRSNLHNKGITMKVITLANLTESTSMEVFQFIEHHLLTQNVKSGKASSNICYYRGENNLKCAAGCLISDDEYNPKFEETRWNTLVQHKLVPAAHRELIQELQYIHDDFPVNAWKPHLDLLRKDIEEGRFDESM